MTSGDLMLSIDVGTSMTKVLAFDFDGRVVAAHRALTPRWCTAPERAESDAESWWTVVATGIRTVLAGAITPSRIRGIGVCGFMHTLVAVDVQGEVLHRPLLWTDQRCAPQVEALSPHAELVERIASRPLTTLSSLPRLLWLRQHEPEVARKARMYLPAKDLVRLRLTGEAATDRGDADGTGLVDRRMGTWSAELVELVHVEVDQLPPIRPANEIAGLVTRSAAKQTGLFAGTPVIVGTTDWLATLLGSGSFLPDRACLYLGSAGALGSFASAAEFDRLGATKQFGCVSSTGLAVQWARELLDGASPESSPLSFKRLGEEADESTAGAHGLTFLPHLSGERGGLVRPHARGAFVGLTLAHGRTDVLRAVLEGTALWLRAVCDRHLRDAGIMDIVALGGGTQIPLWRRICAAVFGRRLLLPETVEGASLGVAILVAAGMDRRHSYQKLVTEWGRMISVEEPDQGLAETYQRLYPRFLQLEDALRSGEEGFQ